MNREANEPDEGRRRVLRLVAVAACLIGTPPGRAALGESTPAASGHSAERFIDAVLPHPHSAQQLGFAYLVREPADLPALLRSLEATVARLRPGLAESRLGVELEQIVRGEYASGDTLVVDGWVLSRTECRLYALAALSA
jgi:hypothetical protein